MKNTNKKNTEEVDLENNRVEERAKIKCKKEESFSRGLLK